MNRVVSGYYAEKIYDEVRGDEIEDNEKLVEVIEEYMKDDEWREAWLSEGKDDYAVVFVNEYGNMIFLLWTVEDELYFTDAEQIPKDEAIAEWFTTMVANYIKNQLW